MLRIFNRKLRIWQLMNENNAANISENPAQNESPDELGASLAFNLAAITRQLGKSSDIIIREFKIGWLDQVNGAIVFIDGLVDTNQVDRDILAPLMAEPKAINPPGGPDIGAPDYILALKMKIVAIGDVKIKSLINDLVNGVLSGDTLLMVEGCREALILSTKGWEKRSVEEPVSEVVVRGPREGFVENLRTNTSLLRRRIRNPDLTFEVMQIGKQTRTDVCIAYIKGIAADSLIGEIKRRLKRIKIDSILESGYIEEFIEDAPFSVFPTVSRSERPDAVAGKILEGRAAILVAGTPFVLTVPMLLIEAFQSPEDYYSRSYYGSLIRWVRYVAFGLSLLLPAIYVALSSFHPELIPGPLLITLAATREGLPFPAVIEALGMGLIFEILREAGIRLPRPIGQAVSIVGALVVGQTAVSAGLVGAPMVIVVALTAIASFVIPSLADPTALLRVALTIMAGVLGAFGIIISLLILLVHLTSLRSFGTPYLSPISPFMASDLKDVAIRAPWWAMILRPHNMGWDDPERQEFRLKPGPSSGQNNDSGDE
jgi:spore germination protein KA